MNNTSSPIGYATAARTWWWHPKPVFAADLQAPGMESAAAGTWWWHPKPVAADTIA